MGGVWGRAASPLRTSYRVWGSAVSSYSRVPQPQIHFGPSKNLENASSGHKCPTQFNFLLSTGGTLEPLDTTGRTLRFRGTPV